jgi:hypothetical protein
MLDSPHEMDFDQDVDAGIPEEPWPSEQRQASVIVHRPIWSLQEHSIEASEQVPDNQHPQKHSDRVASYRVYARSTGRASPRSRRLAFPLPEDDSIRIGRRGSINWADVYLDQLREAANEWDDNPSLLMAANFAADYLPSQASIDAFLRLMAAKDFNCKQV